MPLQKKTNFVNKFTNYPLKYSMSMKTNEICKLIHKLYIKICFHIYGLKNNFKAYSIQKITKFLRTSMNLVSLTTNIRKKSIFLDFLRY